MGGDAGAVEKDETLTTKRSAIERTDRIIEREDGTDIRNLHARTDYRLANSDDTTPAGVSVSSNFGVVSMSLVHQSLIHGVSRCHFEARADSTDIVFKFVEIVPKYCPKKTPSRIGACGRRIRP